MTELEIPFTENTVRVGGTGPNERHRAYSDNGLVPCLHDDGFQIWDTLAICEYLHEAHGRVWPDDIRARARARSVSAEMHSGFGAVRGAMPMNIKLKLNGRPLSADEQADVSRITTIWNSCRESSSSDGPYLFGRFSAADALYAPIVWRFETYNIALTGLAGDYQQTMLDNAAMKAWAKAALAERISLAYDEVVNSFGGTR